MIQNSIDRSCKEQVFVSFFLALAKTPVPKIAFPLALRAKNKWEKNVNLDNFSKLSKLTQSVVENDKIFAGAEKALLQKKYLYSKCSLDHLSFAQKIFELKDDCLI